MQEEDYENEVRKMQELRIWETKGQKNFKENKRESWEHYRKGSEKEREEQWKRKERKREIEKWKRERK